MADSDAEVRARLADGVGSIEQAEWDRLAGTGDPFVRHSFLAALERSGSVGEGTGWSAVPLAIEEAGRIVAAAPAYLKAHSQGEYVFDHAWADAFERAGGVYYPKLQIAVPFTPVPGRRLLGARPQQLLAAVEGIVVQNGLSSAHMTFANEADIGVAVERGWLIRHGIQYHWFNRGYTSFDDFLGALSSRKRKTIRKERAAAREGLEFRALRGKEIGAGERDWMWRFYQDTGSRKWGRPYLTRQFFDDVVAGMGETVLLFLALDNGRPVAGALNWIGEDALYGRYWGTSDARPFLHFELCYYQAMDWAIANRLAVVQAGAQGEHKLARGYEPVITPSAHFLAHPGLRRAVGDFVERERRAVASEIDWLSSAMPYRSSASE